jgi:exopolyphosphatase
VRHFSPTNGPSARRFGQRSKEFICMEEAITAPHLHDYLDRARALAQQGEARRFVLGNESADLDSMASAVACGYHLSATADDGGAPFVPLVNVPRADYKLRTEAVFLLSAVGIGPERLTFIDEVDLDALRAGGELAVVLVDHNLLAAGQAALADAVTGIIDHHKDEGGHPGLALRVIEPVGSAATLVAEVLLGKDAPRLEPGLARLLLGTILLDTVNLDPQAQRATAKDVAIAAQLEAICHADRGALFERLQFEKFNVAALDTADLLRKDYKAFRLGDVRCGIASVLLPVKQWLDKDPDLAESLAAFARTQGLDLLLAMNAYTDPEFRRELVVWTEDEALRERVLAFLRASDLGLAAIDDARAPRTPEVVLFEQANVAYSRKKLQPLLQKLLG